MNFQGKIVDFDQSQNLYKISFNISSEHLNISEGSANIFLKLGGAKVSISDSSKYKLDTECRDYLKRRFLELICTYNQSRAFHKLTSR